MTDQLARAREVHVQKCAERREIRRKEEEALRQEAIQELKKEEISKEEKKAKRRARHIQFRLKRGLGYPNPGRTTSGNCALCGISYSFLETDHIKPRWKCRMEGIDPNTPENLQIICPNCHRSKTQAEYVERGQIKKNIRTEYDAHIDKLCAQMRESQ